MIQRGPTTPPLSCKMTASGQEGRLTHLIVLVINFTEAGLLQQDCQEPGRENRNGSTGQSWGLILGIKTQHQKYSQLKSPSEDEGLFHGSEGKINIMVKKVPMKNTSVLSCLFTILMFLRWPGDRKSESLGSIYSSAHLVYALQERK